MYDHYFSNFGRPLVSDDICKGSAIRHPLFWRTRCLKGFPIQMHREANLTCRKKVKCQYTTFILAILVDLPSPMTYAKIQPQGILGSGEEIFKGFYHRWAWPPPWSMDCDHFSNFSFPLPKEAPYEIWAKLAQGLQRRSRLKMLTDGGADAWTDARRTTDDGHSLTTIAHHEHFVLRWAKNTSRSLHSFSVSLNRSCRSWTFCSLFLLHDSSWRNCLIFISNSSFRSSSRLCSLSNSTNIEQKWAATKEKFYYINKSCSWTVQHATRLSQFQIETNFTFKDFIDV